MPPEQVEQAHAPPTRRTIAVPQLQGMVLRTELLGKSWKVRHR